MTPCEKLGYKVGDRFRILNTGLYGNKENDVAVLFEDDYTYKPFFQVPNGEKVCFGIDDGDLEYIPNITTKDPIEYLKTAHAYGDMIDPATMLRECFGITKTDRVVTEWSDVKQEPV